MFDTVSDRRQAQWRRERLIRRSLCLEDLGVPVDVRINKGRDLLQTARGRQLLEARTLLREREREREGGKEV